MKIYIFILFSVLSLCSFGQNFNYSLKLSCNYPYIANIESTSPFYTDLPLTTGYSTYSSGNTIIEDFSSKIGGQISGNLSYNINSNFFIESGLKLNLLRYKHSSRVEGIDYYSSYPRYIEGSDYSAFYLYEWAGVDASTGVPLWYIDEASPTLITNINNFYYPQSSDEIGKTTILYTAIPINIGYTFNKKLKLKLGIIPSFLVFVQVYEYSYNNTNSEYPRSTTSEAWENRWQNPGDITTYPRINTNLIYSSYRDVTKNKSSDGFSKLVWNTNIELEYMLYRNFGFTLNYSRSLNSVYDENSYTGTPKYNIFSVGLLYNFMKKEKV